MILEMMIRFDEMNEHEREIIIYYIFTCKTAQVKGKGRDDER